MKVLRGLCEIVLWYISGVDKTEDEEEGEVKEKEDMEEEEEVKAKENVVDEVELAASKSAVPAGEIEEVSYNLCVCVCVCTLYVCMDCTC